jgi:hypothetical protein
VTTDAGIKRVTQSESELIATGTALRHARLHGDHLYYTDSGGVWRAPKDGGKRLSLASGVYPDGLAVDDSFVYWISSANQSVSRLSIARKLGEPEEIAPDEAIETAAGVLVDQTRVFWVRKTAGAERAIVAAPKQGGTPAVIASPKLLEGPIWQTSDKLYYARSAGNRRPGALLEQPKAGGPARQLGRGTLSVQALVAGPSELFWLDGTERALLNEPLR